MRLSHLQQLQELQNRSDGDSKWWPAVLIRIVDGEPLNAIARDYACLGVVLREWIRREDDREEQYQEALERKREMRSETLMDRTAAGAFASVADAQTGSGGWLEVSQWPPGLLAACDSVEFGPDGTPYKIRMDAGKHADRLARLMGLDKSQQTNINVMSLVGVKLFKISNFNWMNSCTTLC